jgi:hypothetical protein
MASRRTLKKGVNNLAFDLISECYIYSFFHKDAKNEKINAVMQDILKIRNELVNKINHPEFKEDPKKNRIFYKDIIGNLQNMVGQMDKLGSK